jgi:hypothetical protein
VSPEAPLARVDCSQQERRCVSVEVEICKSAIGFDVLHAEVAQERALSSSRDPEACEMGRPPGVADAEVPPRHVAVDHSKAEIETRTFAPCSAPPPKAVPNGRNEFFEDMDHRDSWSGTPRQNR